MPLRAKVELVNLQGAIKFESLEAALEHVRLTASAHASLANATDITTVYITNNRFFEDAFAAADINVINVGKNFAESINAANDIESMEFGKNVSEAPVVQDVFVRIVEFNRAFSEPVDVTELAAKGVAKPQAEEMSVADADSKNFGKAPIEEITAIGDFSRNVVYKRVPVESLAISDVYVRQVAYSRSFADTVYATDDLDGEASILDDQEIQFFKTRTDAALLSDTFARQVSFNREFNDSGVATELAAKGTGKTLSNSGTFTDDDSFAVGKAASDSSVVSESFARVVAYSRSFSDPAAVAEADSKGVGKILAENPKTQDVFTKVVGYNRYFYDGGLFADGLVSNVGKNTSENISGTDSHSFATSKFLSELPDVTDNAAFGIGRPLNNESLVDELSVKGFGKTQTDPVSFADAGSIVSQGYVDNNQYFAEIYVGTSRTF